MSVKVFLPKKFVDLTWNHSLGNTNFSLICLQNSRLKLILSSTIQKKFKTQLTGKIKLVLAPSLNGTFGFNKR